jgi:hypothetical protein
VLPGLSSCAETHATDQPTALGGQKYVIYFFYAKK